MSSTFTARYRSVCAGCGHSISEGDEARYDDDKAVLHATCRDDVDPLAVTATPCSDCFMVPSVNGVCGC